MNPTIDAEFHLSPTPFSAGDSPKNVLGRQGRNRQAGVALLVVTVMVAIIGILAADFAYHSQVELEAAANARDQLRAEYLARSSIQFGRLLIAAQDQWAQQTKSLPKLSIPGFSLDSIVITDYADLILNLLQADESLLPKNHSIRLKITYEDGKYPLHCSGGLNPDTAQQRNLYYLLYTMFRSSRYDSYFDKQGRDGLQISRENVPRWLVDWTDVDEQAFEPDRPSSASEEKYDRGPEPYEAHNLYMDTLDEMHLVHGIEREPIFQTLAKALTIYHSRDCKISLSGINPDSWPLLSAILATASSEKTTVLDPNTDLVAKQLAPLIKTMWPLLRDQPLAKVLQGLIPGSSESSFKPPSGQTSFCGTPAPSACPLSPATQGQGSRANSASNPSGSTTPPQTTSGGTDQAVTNLSELICSPFLTKLSSLTLSSPLPIGTEQPQPLPSSATLKPIPLCPGVLAQYLKTPSANNPRRFYRIEAIGNVERKQNSSEVRIQGIWDTATVVANPLCDLPKCKRGAWVYFRVN